MTGVLTIADAAQGRIQGGGRGRIFFIILL